MKQFFYRIILFAVVGATVFGCKKDEETVVDVTAEDLATNKWIKENMELYYLWNSSLPDIDETKEADPAAYFEKLLYENDTLSWITDDYASLLAEFEGTPVTYGVDASPTWTSSARTAICFIVNYVYPGSAAANAGLKRGDIILKINNATITLSNYTQFYSSTSMTVQTAAMSNGSLTLTGKSYALTAVVTTTDPAIYHSVLDINGTKIGYLVYVEYVAGSNDAFLTSMDNIFSEFKTAGVTELVVDLRYNSGGEIDAAAHLASAIAPASVVSAHSTLVKMNYNTDLQAFLESDSKYSGYLTTDFADNASNLDLNRVYFLTTGRTASASELTMIGLMPYMNVTLIGEPTFGKYTGMWVMPDDNEEWCMVPIVMKYSNANGYTDFGDGLTPDYELDDYPYLGYQFGDTSEPFLAKAISLITGTATASTKSARIPLLERADLSRPGELKNNLFIPVIKGLPKAE